MEIASLTASRNAPRYDAVDQRPRAGVEFDRFRVYRAPCTADGRNWEELFGSSKKVGYDISVKNMNDVIHLQQLFVTSRMKREETLL